MPKSKLLVRTTPNPWAFIHHFSPLLFAASFLIVVLVLLYQNLGRDALFNWDEGIYAELGRELILKKDLLTSFWNGSIWLEKPPLISWVTALGMIFFGQSELGARFFMPCFAVATLFLVYLIGKRLGTWRLGLSAASLLAYFDLFLGRSRAVNTDGILLTAITATIYTALSGGAPWLVALFVALAVMGKGVAGLLALILVFPLLLLRGRQYAIRCTLFAISYTLPWHLYQYMVHGQSFFTPYLLEQVVRRATVPIEFHLESRWFYLEYLWSNLGLGILFVAALGLGLILLRTFLKRTFLKETILVWWVFLPLGIFTLAKTRLFWYLLPVYPALALLIAYFLDSLATTKTSKNVFTILLVGIMGQSLLKVASSVELQKTTVTLPSSVSLAISLRSRPETSLAVLVPLTERVAEAILPKDQRLSSSFRYGGAPNLVFYSQKHVLYYYNLDDWRKDLGSGSLSLGMLTLADKDLIPEGWLVWSAQGDYLSIVKGTLYALR